MIDLFTFLRTEDGVEMTGLLFVKLLHVDQQVWEVVAAAVGHHLCVEERRTDAAVDAKVHNPSLADPGHGDVVSLGPWSCGNTVYHMYTLENLVKQI